MYIYKKVFINIGKKVKGLLCFLEVIPREYPFLMQLKLRGECF